MLASPFKSKMRLEAENAVLRHQLNVVRRGRLLAFKARCSALELNLMSQDDRIPHFWNAFGRPAFLEIFTARNGVD
jgi:hypothetical protein